MKNNEFKKIIRNEIKKECKALDFQSVSVDITNNSRMIYIYTLEYKFAGVFSLWVGNDNIHLSFTNLTTLPLIQHRVKESNVKYTKFNEVVEAIKEAFDIMDKTDG